MRNPRFRRGHVWALCVVLVFLAGISGGEAQPDKEIDRLAKAYRAARTEFERRAVCLDAIDSGVIARDRPVVVVDAIFGTTYAKRLPPPREVESGIVLFRQPQPRAPTSGRAVQVPYVGWYFGFEYDSAGKLELLLEQFAQIGDLEKSRVCNTCVESANLARSAFVRFGNSTSYVESIRTGNSNAPSPPCTIIFLRLCASHQRRPKTTS